jgi:hypothetical protein
MNLSGSDVTPLVLTFTRDSSAATQDRTERRPITARQRALTEEAKTLLTRWMTRRVLLADSRATLAVRSSSVPPFRIVVEMTINAYQRQLRLWPVSIGSSMRQTRT